VSGQLTVEIPFKTETSLLCPNCQTVRSLDSAARMVGRTNIMMKEMKTSTPMDGMPLIIAQ
jgi:hypothetical protein